MGFYQGYGTDPISISLVSMIRIHIRRRKAGSGSAFAAKYRTFSGSKWSPGRPWGLTMEAWRLKMEPWRVSRPTVAYSHHFDEEQDTDPD
jgi:hypothetical protein